MSKHIFAQVAKVGAEVRSIKVKLAAIDDIKQQVSKNEQFIKEVASFESQLEASIKDVNDKLQRASQYQKQASDTAQASQKMVERMDSSLKALGLQVTDSPDTVVLFKSISKLLMSIDGIARQFSTLKKP